MLIPVIQNGVDLFVDSAQIAIPWSSVFGRPAIVDTLSRLPNGAGVLVNDGAGNLSWASVGGGSVTSVGLAAPASFTVSGSPVTGAGTLTLAYAAGYQAYTTLESAKLATIAPGATVGATWGVNLFSRPAVITNLGALANAAGLLANDGIGNLAWLSPAGIGTVTLVNTGNGLLGGPITTAGTIYVDENYNFNWTGNHRFAAGFILDVPLFAIYGGTGFGAYTAGDLLYANSTTTLAKLAVGSANDFLTVSGGAPAWTARSGLFANPGVTPNVDLVGSNGSATTGLRSDAVMVLNQGIVPTWTALHIFTKAAASGFTGAPINLISAWPGIYFEDTNAATDAKKYDFFVNDGVFEFRLKNDAGSGLGNYLTFTRTGAVATSMVYGNSADKPLHRFYGNVGIGTAPGTAARLSLYTTEGGASGGADLGYNVGAVAYNFFYADAHQFQTASASFRNQLTLTQSASTYGNSTDYPTHTFYGDVVMQAPSTSTYALQFGTSNPAVSYISINGGGGASTETGIRFTNLGDTWYQYIDGSGSIFWYHGAGAKVQFGPSGEVLLLAGLGDFANDALAAAGGVAVNQLYRTGSLVAIRVT